MDVKLSSAALHGNLFAALPAGLLCGNSFATRDSCRDNCPRIIPTDNSSAVLSAAMSVDIGRCIARGIFRSYHARHRPQLSCAATPAVFPAVMARGYLQRHHLREFSTALPWVLSTVLFAALPVGNIRPWILSAALYPWSHLPIRPRDLQVCPPWHLPDDEDDPELQFPFYPQMMTPWVFQVWSCALNPGPGARHQ